MNKTIVQYFISGMVIVAILELIILPGLKSPNTITNFLSLFGFIIVVCWGLGIIKISYTKEKEEKPN
tara:strand:+ start:369 stop:569 length:201 start_codon:yes stop_codon:yes gene_type:complete